MNDAVQIGEWRFSPSAAELRRGDERHALEDRAARVLAVLVRERGQIVSQEQLISEVWNGRSLSANSVAVVIGDLRRALGDDARAPKHIETVAKRGYRLAETVAPTRHWPRRSLWPVAAAVVLAAAVLTAVSASRGGVRTPVAVAEISNETGDESYAPLARAVREVVFERASSDDTLRVSADRSGQEVVVVSGRLILWSGHPSVSLSAVDPRSGEVIWSAMAPGPEDMLPGQIRGKMDELPAALAEHH